VGPRAVLNAVVKRKNSQLPPGIEPYNPDRPARSEYLGKVVRTPISSKENSLSGHKFRPIHDLFLPHDYIRPVVSYWPLRSLSFVRSIVKVLWISNIFHSANMPYYLLLLVKNLG
jgi:hypothetical protein